VADAQRRALHIARFSGREGGAIAGATHLFDEFWGDPSPMSRAN
jgi:hypothetical protein